MKVRPACAAVVSIGTALLLLAGIRCAQAAEIKIVSPGAYEDIEGEGATGDGLLRSFPLPAGVSRRGLRGAGQPTALDRRLHQPAGPKPDESWYRPTSQTTRSAYLPCQWGPPNLSLVFDDNLGPDVMQFYRGPLN